VVDAQRNDRSRAQKPADLTHTGFQLLQLLRLKAEDRPPVLIPFFGFRIMVGMGLIMLAVSWFEKSPPLACGACSSSSVTKEYDHARQ